MKKLNLKNLAAAALIMFTLNIGVQAQDRGPQKNKSRQEQLGKEQRRPMQQRIPDLTEEQDAALKTLKVTHEKESLPLKNQVNELEAQLQTLITQEEINKTEAGRVIERLGDIKVEMMKLKVDHTTEVKSILTDEQKVFFNRQLTRQKDRQPPRGR